MPYVITPNGDTIVGRRTKHLMPVQNLRTYTLLRYMPHLVIWADPSLRVRTARTHLGDR